MSKWQYGYYKAMNNYFEIDTMYKCSKISQVSEDSVDILNILQSDCNIL